MRSATAATFPEMPRESFLQHPGYGFLRFPNLLSDCFLLFTLSGLHFPLKLKHLTLTFTLRAERAATACATSYGIGKFFRWICHACYVRFGFTRRATG